MKSLLFKNGMKDRHYLVQVLFLFLLISFPFINSLWHDDKLTILFYISFILFILYGILLLEKPSILLIVSGGTSILILLLSTGVEITGVRLYTWPTLMRPVLLIFYCSFLGLRLLGDTLRENVSVKLLYISIANYLIIGIIFHFLFLLTHLLNGAAFNFPVQKSYDHIYMSFIVLCSVGLGDLLPLSPLAKFLVMLEAIAGQIYLTFFVAIIIGKYLGEAKMKKNS